MLKNTTTQFDFSAKPKVTALKPKYRQRQTQRFDGTNLMNDPRIIRGNTYAAIVENTNEIKPPPIKKQPSQQQKKPQPQHRRINFDTGFQPQTPRALDGRQHFSIQTQPFVQTLRDKPIQYERQCQTDLFLDKPVEREFNPMKQKTGVDQRTQIDQNDPELFNFDYEVEPILDALLSKVVETSRMELYEEQELETKEKEKIQYEKRRHSRLAEAQKLQAKEIRLKEQSQRRNLQYKKSNQQETFTQKKLISRILSKQYLRNLHPNTNTILSEQGFFRQPLETQLYAEYTPWIYEKILEELHANQTFENEIVQMGEAAQGEMEKQAQSWIDKERDRRQGILDERAEKIRQKEEMKEAKRREKEAEQARIKAEEEAALRQQEEQQQAEGAEQPAGSQAPPS